MVHTVMHCLYTVVFLIRVQKDGMMILMSGITMTLEKFMMFVLNIHAKLCYRKILKMIFTN